MKTFSICVNGVLIVNYNELEWRNISFMADQSTLNQVVGGLEVKVDCDGFEKTTKIDIENIETFDIRMRIYGTD